MALAGAAGVVCACGGGSDGGSNANDSGIVDAPGVDADDSIASDAEVGGDDACGSLDGGANDAATAVELPKPSGGNAIGRHRYAVVDATRGEPNGSDPAAHRAFTVELWYPSAACDGAPPAPYLSDVEGFAVGGKANWWKGVRTHARADVPFVADGATHPVLLFSHGYNGLPRAYQAFLEEAASRGYVVAAIAHAYWAALTEFPDGHVISSTHPTIASNPAGDAEEGTWVADAQSTLDALAAWNGADPDGLVTGRLDLAHVGYFGHSFGGAAAIDALAHEPRVLAAIDFDGTIFGPDRTTFGPVLSRPAILFSSVRPADGTFDPVFSQSTAPIWELTLAGSKHLNFGDFGLIASTSGIAFTVGTIDATRALTVIDAYVDAFFDSTLLGKTAPLLDAASSTYPEIRFQRRN
jgi:dienelactone hydrolase